MKGIQIRDKTLQWQDLASPGVTAGGQANMEAALLYSIFRNRNKVSITVEPVDIDSMSAYIIKNNTAAISKKP